MPIGDMQLPALVDVSGFVFAPAAPPSRMAPLAPERTGYVSVDQPVLWFYLSDPWPDDMEFALNKPRARRPELEIVLEGPFEKGVYGVALADFDVKLAPDIEYEWLLAIVLDPEERSADFLASATIRFVVPSPDSRGRLAETPLDRLPHAYAEQGYFYDAMEVLSKRIESETPRKASTLRRHRGALQEQVKLPLAATFDKI